MSDRPPKQVRELLLLEAARLAVAQDSATRLNIAEVTAAAKLGESDFYLCFPDRRAFLLDLLKDFLDQTRADAIDALGRVPAGIPRIVAAFESYWDANCRWRPMRELALHFRNDAEGAELLRLRAHGAATIAQYELKAIGWKHPAASARLAMQMCVETAVAEFEVRHPLPDMREATLAYFREPWPKQPTENDFLP